MRKFEVLAAYALGIGLPALEIARRRTDMGSGLRNVTVVAVKLLVYAIALSCLALTVRRAGSID